MKRVCPNPIPWNNVYTRLAAFAATHNCSPSDPPKPLILSGWTFSNDIDKLKRWNETVSWAKANDCEFIVKRVADPDFYYVSALATYKIGPLGGPLYREWEFDSKNRPLDYKLRVYIQILHNEWPRIIGNQLALITQPENFTGVKARRLLIRSDFDVSPPWGGWSFLSQVENERRTFTRFRAAVNAAIEPHEVDHIDFKPW